MAESAFFTLVYKYLGQQQIPTVSGQPYDGGPEWADPSSHDLVDGAGAQNPNTPNLGWEWLIKILKADKITKLATLANGFSAQVLRTPTESRRRLKQQESRSSMKTTR